MKYVKSIQEKRIWSIDFIVQLTGSLPSAKSLMTSYVKRHIVSSVRRNMYVANDLATGRAMVSKYEIASNIMDGSYVAYHSALEFYGLAHQQSFEVHVGATKRFRMFRFEDMDYVSCTNKITEGIVTPTMNSLVRVTDLERTVVDSIDRVDLAGGCEELLNCLSACHRIDIAKLVSYTYLYKKQVLFRKVGIICEIFAEQWKVQAEQIEQLRVAGGSSMLFFTDRNDSTHFLKKWRMNVPDEIMCYFENSETNDII